MKENILDITKTRLDIAKKKLVNFIMIFKWRFQVSGLECTWESESLTCALCKLCFWSQDSLLRDKGQESYMVP